jgi:hypothetical protein
MRGEPKVLHRLGGNDKHEKKQWIIIIVALLIIVLFRGRSLTTTLFGESAPKFVKLEPGNIGMPNGRSPQFGTLPIPKLPAILSSSCS